MRGTKSSLSIILVIGLLAGSAVGVAAQEDALTTAPVEVTGTSELVGFPDPGTTEALGLFERTIGGTCQMDWTMSDERLTSSSPTLPRSSPTASSYHSCGYEWPLIRVSTPSPPQGSRTTL